MTNKQKFVEVFGCEPKMNVVMACPPTGVRKTDCKYIYCGECLKWWDEPYKEPEGAAE